MMFSGCLGELLTPHDGFVSKHLQRCSPDVFSSDNLNLTQLNGRFFLAFHDGARNEQVVITDRLKTAPKQAIMVGPAACPSTRNEN